MKKLATFRNFLSNPTTTPSRTTSSDTEATRVWRTDVFLLLVRKGSPLKGCWVRKKEDGRDARSSRKRGGRRGERLLAGRTQAVSLTVYDDAVCVVPMWLLASLVVLPPRLLSLPFLKKNAAMTFPSTFQRRQLLDQQVVEASSSTLPRFFPCHHSCPGRTTLQLLPRTYSFFFKTTKICAVVGGFMGMLVLLISCCFSAGRELRGTRVERWWMKIYRLEGVLEEVLWISMWL